MPSARLLIQRYWGVVLLVLTVLKPTPVAAASYPTCTQGSSCVVGEFVYADDAAPLTTATCSATIFNPSGSKLVNAAHLTSTVDAWYAYSFTPTGANPVGTYPAQICCTTPENDICIDKTFVLTAVTATPTPGLTSTDVTNAVWNSQITGHTAAGTFGQKVNSITNNPITPSDIWGYTNRSLTSFGTLVGDIWSHATRSLTSVTNITNGVWNEPLSSHSAAGSAGQQLGQLQNNPITPSDIWGYTNRTLSSFGTLLTDIIAGVWNEPTASHTAAGTYGQAVGANPNLSAADVWNYSDRSVTNTASISAAVWKYDERALTSVTNIASTVWDYQDRSLNSYANLVNAIWSHPRSQTASISADLTELTNQIKASRSLLDQLVNTPTVDTYLDADPAPKLQSKLSSTKEYVTQIASNLELASTKVGLVTLKWDQLSDADRNQEIQAAITLLGTDETKTPKTVIGQLNWLAAAWDKPLTRDVYAQTVSLRDDLGAFLTTLQASPANAEQLTYLNQLYGRFTSLKVSVGDVSQTETDPTLFGLVKTLTNVAANLDAQEQALTAAVNDWDTTPAAVRPQLVAALAASLSKLNQLPALNTLLSPLSPSKEFLTNLRSLINLNRAVLAAGNGEAVTGTFISTDPIRFRTLVHNPSKQNPQTAKVNFLLPAELTQEQITNVDPRFTVTYDPSAKAMRVTGNIDLEPGESKLIDLTANDIWQIRTEAIDALRKQAAELLKPLENSPVYNQASTIKSNIDVALDTIISLRDKATTPNGKIQAYHQAQVLLTEVTKQIDQLKALVNQNQSNTALMGFVGGAQAIAVWGIIIIFIAGFVFLTLYMRALYQNTITQPTAAPADTALTLPLTGPAYIPAPRPLPEFSLPFTLPRFDFLTGRTFNLSLILLSSLLLTLIVTRRSSIPLPPSSTEHPTTPAVVAPPLPLSPLDLSATPSAAPPPSPAAASSSADLLITPSNAASSINVRRDPTTSSPKVAEITEAETALELEVSGDWFHVQLIDHDPVVSGWVHKDYVTPISPEINR